MKKAIKKEKSTAIVNMKVTAAMKREWYTKAKSKGLNLSQWIKERCND